jgi:hypothetical protein
MLTRLAILIFIAALLLGVVQNANACQCLARPTVLDEFESSDEVVILRFTSVERAVGDDAKNHINGIRTATAVVEKVFKGKLKVREEIVFGQGGGGDCLWTFSEKYVGYQFLVYLTRPENFWRRNYLPEEERGLWFASVCGRSTSLGAATEDLSYLENIKKLQGKTRISGTIGGWQLEGFSREGRKVKFIGPKKTYETKTDKEGLFEIYDVPPGKYFVETEPPPGWKVEPESLRDSVSIVKNDSGEPELSFGKQVAILLAPKKHARVDIDFSIDNKVRGRVLGPTGKPMTEVCVSLLPPGKLSGGNSDCTDQQGRFEIKTVPEGEYVLVANEDDKPSYSMPFRRIFYPNVPERERAAVLHIGPGDVIEDLDIVVSRLEETITVKGVLRYADGNPVPEEWISFEVPKANDKIDGYVRQKTDSEGRFTLTILKGLTGKLTAEKWLFEGLYKKCPKVDEILAKSGDKSMDVQTNVITLTTEENVFDVELTFPFPLCEKAKP